MPAKSIAATSSSTSRAGNEVRGLFEDHREDLDTFFAYLSALYATQLIGRETLVVFDEVQRFPLAREFSTKSLDKFRDKFPGQTGLELVLHPKQMVRRQGRVYLPLYMAHLA